MYWSGAKTVRFPLPANVLNGAPLPSIAGLEASRPILPRPSTAVSLVMTAIRLPRAVYSNALAGSAAIFSPAGAAPGEYAQARSRWLVNCWVG